MSLAPKQTQIPDSSILDLNGKQAYLGNQFVAGTAVITLSDTNEDTLIYLSNPAGSSKSIFNALRRLAGGSTTQTVTFSLYANPTGVSAGTAITPQNCRLASSTASIASCVSQPTISTKGTLIATYPLNSSYLQSPSGILLILDPGQSLLITAKASATSQPVVGEFSWWEL